MNVLIWYPKCSTCQNAKKILEELDLQFNLRDIKEERLNESELRELITKSKLDIKKFFNTSGLKYKELGLKDKLPNYCEEEKIALLASDGMLVKRPILVYDGKVIVGKKENEYRALIGSQEGK